MALSTYNDQNEWNKKNAFKSFAEASAAAKKNPLGLTGGSTYNIYQTSGGSWHFQPQIQNAPNTGGQILKDGAYTNTPAQAPNPTPTPTPSYQPAPPRAKIPAFNFDWAAADREELAKLTPYYEKLLADAGGDVNRAKGRLEEDYSTGVRNTQQDYSNTTRQADEDKAAQDAALALEQETQTRQMRGDLNARGVLVGENERDQSGQLAPDSGYAKQWFIDPQNQQMDLRKQAVDRAVQRQKEAAGLTSTRTQEALATTRNRGVEDQTVAFNKYKTAMDEEKKQKAILQMAPLRYQQEYQRWQYLNGQA